MRKLGPNKIISDDGKLMIIEGSDGNPFKIDSEDYHRIKDLRWHTDGMGYVSANRWINKKVCAIRIYRIILNNKGIDHIDGDKRNNCKSNLRLCTQKQNTWNSKKPIRKNIKRKQTLYKGVYCFKSGLKKPWMARIAPNGKAIYLGYYKTDVEAAKAYDDAAKKYFGEFAKLNFT